MPEFCYTATQVKLIKTSIIFMAGITLFQTLTIRRLVRGYERGSLRFKNLQDCTSYLLNVLAENNIDLTEFDVIAITDILEGD